MNAVSKFIVLVERRRLRTVAAWALATLALLVGLLGFRTAQAQTAQARSPPTCSR